MNINSLFRLTPFVIVIVNGCAHYEFEDPKGLAYYEPKPYVMFTISEQCVWTATPLALPAVKKHVKFVNGYGSSNLSIDITNGMITKIGQQSDVSSVPAAITSAATLATTVATLSNPITVTRGLHRDGTGVTDKKSGKAAQRPAADTTESTVCIPKNYIYAIDEKTGDIEKNLAFSLSVK